MSVCSSQSPATLKLNVQHSTSMFNYCALILFPSVCNTGPSVTGVGGLWYGTVHSATCTAWTWRDLVAKCSLEQPLKLDLVQHGGTVVSPMASQQEGSNPRPAAQDPSVWNLHVLPVLVWFSSGCSSYLPPLRSARPKVVATQDWPLQGGFRILDHFGPNFWVSQCAICQWRPVVGSGQQQSVTDITKTASWRALHCLFLAAD